MSGKLIAIATLLFVGLEVTAQTIGVTGTVVDSLTGVAVSGVHISTASNGTISAEGGGFAMRVSEGETLYFTHVNYYPAVIDYSSIDRETPFLVKMKERVRVLQEISVRGILTEEQLRSSVLTKSPTLSREEENLLQNSSTINQISKIAPLPAPTLSEQFFESLQGPKDVTIFSSNPTRGLFAIIKNLSNPAVSKPIGPRSNYQPDPTTITPFRITLFPADTVKQDSSAVVRTKD